MIKANELRLGNWVLHNDAPSTHEYTNTNFQISLDFFYDLARSHVSEYNIEPIPLTPEILDKCGFAPMSEKDKDELEIEFTERLVYKNTAICCVLNGVEFVFHYGLDADLAFASCAFVHQLQNLIFSLTNEELKINLC